MINQFCLYPDYCAPNANFKGIRGRDRENWAQLNAWGYTLSCIGKNATYGGKAQKTDRSWILEWWTDPLKAAFLATNRDGYPEFDPASPMIRALAAYDAGCKEDGSVWLMYDMGAAVCPFKSALPEDHRYQTDSAWMTAQFNFVAAIRAAVGDARKLIANVTAYPFVLNNQFSRYANDMANLLDGMLMEMGDWTQYELIKKTLLDYSKPFIFCYRDPLLKEGKLNPVNLAHWLTFAKSTDYLTVCIDGEQQVDITPYLPQLGAPLTNQPVQEGMTWRRRYERGETYSASATDAGIRLNVRTLSSSGIDLGSSSSHLES